MAGGRGRIAVAALVAGAAIVVAGVFPLLGLGGGKSYHFPRVEIDAVLNPDGSLDLRERRTFDFDGEFSFAYFTIAWPFQQIEGFRVTEGGRRLPTDIENVGTFKATWHYSAEDERRTFTIRYRALCAARVYEDAAHLLWQFVGTGWTERTDQALIRLRLPEVARGRPQRLPTCQQTSGRTAPGRALRRGEARAWGHGPLQGEVRFADPATVELELRDLTAVTFVEGSVLLPPEAVSLAPQIPVPRRQAILDEEARLAREANEVRRRALAEERRVAAGRRLTWPLLPAVPILMALLVVVSRRRDRVSGVPRMLQEPPEDLAPMDLARLWGSYRGTLSPAAAYRVQLLELVRSGAIEMRAVGGVSDPDDLMVRLVRRPPDGLEARFVNILFGDDGDRELSLKQVARSTSRGTKLASSWWNRVSGSVRGMAAKVRTGRFEGKLVTLIGLAGMAFAPLGSDATAGLSTYLFPVALVSMLVAHWVMHPLVTPEYRHRIAAWSAFRRFLRKFSSLPDAPALAITIWEHYLLYAVALGVADNVERQVKALVPEEELPSPWVGAPSGIGGLGWASFVSSSVSPPSPPGSSGGGSFSSGGGGGGGFSGGGGGGGGGTGGGAG